MCIFYLNLYIARKEVFLDILIQSLEGVVFYVTIMDLPDFICFSTVA